MPTEINMPALSPTMEQGTLALWLVAEGDQVAAGDVIAEIETDKATMELEASAAGRLAQILVPAGTEGVAVNSPIAILVGEDENSADALSNNANGEASIRHDPKGVAERKVASALPDPEPAGTRILVSPLARRIAEQAGLDVSHLEGSGPRGRIVLIDVQTRLAAKDKSTEARDTQPTKRETPRVEPQASPTYAEGTFELIKLDSMRRTIAQRLTEAKQTVPHFYLRTEIRLDALLALRAQINEMASHDGSEVAYKISVNDFVIKAFGLALRDVPDANVTWADGGMRRHRDADVSIAVAIEGGLVTPVVRAAQTKSISTISQEIKSLAMRARERRLAPEEYQGGTASVSNLGMFGVRDFDAIINPPQGTILAVGVGEERALVRHGVLEAASAMSVTLSVDHRMIDGALGAALLECFKGYMENPLTILA